jgi:hypothetical protein
MAIFKQRSVWWFLANALGMAAFLAFASRAWIEPELADEPGLSAGDSIVWGISALPVLIIFFVAHLIVGGWALAKMRRDWAWVLALTVICWMVAAVFDNAHHGI